MTIVSRIFASAALFSLALVSSVPGPVSGLSIEHADVHARAASHHARADSIRRLSEDLNTPQRRCKPRPSSPVTSNPPVIVSSSSFSHTPTPSTSHSTSTSSKPKPSSSSSSSYTPVASPKPPANPGGGKVGLAWANGEDPCLGKYVTSKTKYLYTWDAHLPKNIDQFGLQGARMLWGSASNRVTAFRELRDSSNILMGMNEVNEPSQANMDVSSGIALWNAEIRPLGLKGHTLVSPSVTSSDTGVKWLQAFFAQCGDYDGQSKCGVDYLAVHYYGNTAKGFISYVEKFWKLFNIKIWVTEFACEDFYMNNQCDVGQVWSFMETVTGWMDSTDYVEAYFAFGILHDMWNVNYLNQLMASDCSPTALGYYYISA